jgi:hypothetical protein
MPDVALVLDSLGLLPCGLDSHPKTILISPGNAVATGQMPQQLEVPLSQMMQRYYSFAAVKGSERVKSLHGNSR